MEPNPAPFSDLIHHVEGTRGTSPAQSQGLIHQLLDPAINVLRRGRVEDVYMDRNCAVVSLFSYRRNVACLWVSSVLNKWCGAKRVAPPAVGSEVVVILSNDQKYGVILGVINSTREQADKQAGNLFDTPVDRSSDNEMHKAKDFGYDDFLINNADGINSDIFPGDDVSVNLQGALNATLEFVALLRGGNGAMIEAFVIDQLIRVTAYNYEERTSFGEKIIFEDHGFITEEESGTYLHEESIGGAVDEKDDLQRITMLRRFSGVRGFLGGFIQRFILRPNKEGGKMDKAEETPDLGLRQEFTHLSGMSIDKTLTGGGLLKGIAIPVPRKRFEVDDPEGDNTAPKNKPVPPFIFSQKPKTPASIVCQLRDFFAYHFNKVAAARFLERNKDWHLPDENECPVVSDPGYPPKSGEFYREFPKEVDAMTSADSDSVVTDPSSSMGTRPGTAWAMVLPDGSVSLRDIWGSHIEMRGGHIEISASKDIRFLAGGTIVGLGGDDVVLKARKSMDLSTTKGQMRIKSQNEVFIHAEEGGMLLSLGSQGHEFVTDQGEGRFMPGICLKVPGGGILMDASHLNLNISNVIHFNQGSEDNGDGEKKFPALLGNISGTYFDFKKGGIVYRWKSKDKGEDAYCAMLDGNYYGTGVVQIEDSIYCKGPDAVFGSEPVFPGDWSNVPPLASLLEPVFKDFEKYQYPYELDELQDVIFLFRTTENYATVKGRWFETAWQRDLRTAGEGDKWEEWSAADGSFPYPGDFHYGSGGTYWTYDESNVTPSGRSINRDGLSNDPDGFKESDWNSILVHPER